MGITHKWNGTILEITSDSGTSAADLKGAKGDTGARGVRGLPGERGGGAAIEDGIISTETTWSSAGIMDNFAEHLSVEGNPVVCNPIPNYPLHVITNIEPKQSGSGEPCPAGTGKNLLDTTNAIKATNSVSDVASDGKITIKGSLPAQWTNTYIGAFNMVSGKAYTISGVLGYGRIGFSTNPNIIPGNTANPNISTGSTDIINWNRSTATFTANETKTVYVWYCTDSANNGSNSAFTMGLQIEKGSTATAYQPYENIRPISGFDAVNVVRCGKNLLDISTFPAANYSGSTITTAISGNTLTLTGSPTATWKLLESEIECIGLCGKSITLSGTLGGTEPYFSVRCVDASGNILIAKSLNKTGNVTLNVPSGTEKLSMRACLNQLTTGSNYTATYTNMMIEVGATATTYEPYNGNTFTMSLGETVYGGSLDWNTGELMVNKQYIQYNGTENWTYHQNGFFYIALSNPAINNNKCVISSHYKTDMGLGVTIVSTGTKYNQLRFYATGYSNVADWKAYLAAQAATGTPLQVVYELAEPYTIQLTPQEIKAIKGQNTLYTDANSLQVIGRVDTMYQLSLLTDRVAALEAALINA